ncbi:hypothetical protein [Thermostichus vulcanus]|uniref:Helix-turn-helix domain-containing protein n=1 Tax=Thermostichus vulcanus str. 'Rupite' TaxID=2813851 RepID=A0ABT0CF68_THEVL|nr:hypothetical protein [Thermostichus vulcanus]MCJ2544364.1 hypothetical protein [Thermostichus vulcanus str. 'Rupite']
MARSKLSEQEQQQIVSTYRGSPATAVELAEQFQVSISTIARVLKENIEADEYQQLVSSKRSAARRRETGEEISESPPPEPVSSPSVPGPEPIATPVPNRTRRRSSSLRDPEAQQQVLPLTSESEAAPADPTPDPTLEEEDLTETELPSETLKSAELELVAELEEELEEDETDDDSELEDLEDEEEEDEDSDDFLEDAPAADSLAEAGYSFQVLPLEELIPPETCYAVIDRYQELATRPLKEFFNLGSLPSNIEGLDSANTLPIFDNHKVARRFSEMSRRGSNTYPPYRVIQFPGHILEAVRTQLQNKGITHLLMDGQIYTL